MMNETERKNAYVKFYIGVMENNWEWNNARKVSAMKDVDEAIKFIESCDYTTFEDCDWI